MGILKSELLPSISEEEFCEHIVDDDFPIRFGNPVRVCTESCNDLICLTIELYERMSGERILDEHEEACKHSKDLEDRTDRRR